MGKAGLRMKKYKYLLVMAAVSAVLLTGCKEGEYQDQIPERTVKYDLILNQGSCFVFTFEDPETGVWYISASDGVTPRLDENGELYRQKEER